MEKKRTDREQDEFPETPRTTQDGKQNEPLDTPPTTQSSRVLQPPKISDSAEVVTQKKTDDTDEFRQHDRETAGASGPQDNLEKFSLVATEEITLPFILEQAASVSEKVFQDLAVRIKKIMLKDVDEKQVPSASDVGNPPTASEIESLQSVTSEEKLVTVSVVENPCKNLEYGRTRLDQASFVSMKGHSSSESLPRSRSKSQLGQTSAAKESKNEHVKSITKLEGSVTSIVTKYMQASEFDQRSHENLDSLSPEELLDIIGMAVSVDLPGGIVSRKSKVNQSSYCYFISKGNIQTQTKIETEQKSETFHSLEVGAQPQIYESASSLRDTNTYPVAQSQQAGLFSSSESMIQDINDRRALILFPVFRSTLSESQDIASIIKRPRCRSDENRKPILQPGVSTRSSNPIKIQVKVNSETIPKISSLGIARIQFIPLKNTFLVLPRPISCEHESFGCIIPYGYALYLMHVSCLDGLTDEKYNFYHLVYLGTAIDSNKFASTGKGSDQYILCYIKAPSTNSEFTEVTLDSPNLENIQLNIQETDEEPRVAFPVPTVRNTLTEEALNIVSCNTMGLVIATIDSNKVTNHFKGYRLLETDMDGTIHSDKPSFCAVNVRFKDPENDFPMTILLSDIRTKMHKARKYQKINFSKLIKVQSDEPVMNFKPALIDTNIYGCKNLTIKTDHSTLETDFHNLYILACVAVKEGPIRPKLPVLETQPVQHPETSDESSIEGSLSLERGQELSSGIKKKFITLIEDPPHVTIQIQDEPLDLSLKSYDNAGEGTSQMDQSTSKLSSKENVQIPLSGEQIRIYVEGPSEENPDQINVQQRGVRESRDSNPESETSGSQGNLQRPTARRGRSSPDDESSETFRPKTRPKYE